jgi:hypothetical protein
MADLHLCATAPKLYAALSKIRDSMVCVCRLNKTAALLGAGIECEVCCLNKLLAEARGEVHE